MTPRRPTSVPPKGPSTGSAPLSQNGVTILVETFRFLGDPSRLKVTPCCTKGSTPISNITEAVKLSQSLVNYHLRLLRRTHLVRDARQSKQTFYEVADKHVSQVLPDMAIHIAEGNGDD